MFSTGFSVDKPELAEGTDGEAILPAEVNITYETDVDGIIAIDEENHTFETLQNGDVTITITASVGDTEQTDTVKLTVADAGENFIKACSSVNFISYNVVDIIVLPIKADFRCGNIFGCDFGHGRKGDRNVAVGRNLAVIRGCHFGQLLSEG